MNKKPDQTGQDIAKGTKRLGAWVRLVGVVYRLLITVGLILLGLAIFAILFTSHFSLWILALPLSLISLGIILAWIEFQLHDRNYALQSRDLDQDDEKEQGHGKA